MVTGDASRCDQPAVAENSSRLADVARANGFAAAEGALLSAPTVILKHFWWYGGWKDHRARIRKGW